MLKGICGSGGIGIGKVVILKNENVSYLKPTILNPEQELKRYQNAHKKFLDKNMHLAEKLKESTGEKEAEIIKGHIAIISDSFMQNEITNNILRGFCAEEAIEAVCKSFSEMLMLTDDELTKQRITDIDDIKDGMLKVLLGIEENSLSDLPENSILVVSDLTPSMTAELDVKSIEAIITETGGRTSHSAILARSLGIPAVMSVENATQELANDSVVIVDAEKGIILDSPTLEEKNEYSIKKKEFENKKELLQKYKNSSTKTADGKSFSVFANIGSLTELESAIENGAEGIGLFRTEFLFLGRSSLPSEEEQFEIYKKATVKMRSMPIIIRTIDIGGDKDIPYLNMKKEENPFLGFRAIRYCLKYTDIFKTQLRAILRASAFGDIRIMLPLITGIEEINSAKKLINEIMGELSGSGIEYNKEIKIGIMVETPSAAIIIDSLLPSVDFVSIGTNDLTQYVMAVDRGNSDVSYLYSHLNPALLKIINKIICSCMENNVSVGMCGEAAADVLMTPFLIALGLDKFSVTPSAVPMIRRAISLYSIAEAEDIKSAVLSMKTTESIYEYLKNICHL